MGDRISVEAPIRSQCRSDEAGTRMPAVTVPDGCKEALTSFELAWRAFVQRLSLAAVEIIMPSDGLQVMVD